MDAIDFDILRKHMKNATQKCIRNDFNDENNIVFHAWTKAVHAILVRNRICPCTKKHHQSKCFLEFLDTTQKKLLENNENLSWEHFWSCYQEGKKRFFS